MVTTSFMFQRFKNACEIPKRFIIAIMMFLSCVISYMVRVNLSLNIIAMVVHIPTKANQTYESLNPDYGPRYNWSVSEQSLMLSAYFWGYCSTSLFGGPISEKIGGRNANGYTLLASAVLNTLIPQSAEIHYWVVFANRFLTGALAGVLYPANHNLISKWSPPDEKGKFIASLMGGTFGTVLSWPISGAIVESLGWVWAFYIIGIVNFIIAIAWFYLVADRPSKHSSIKKEELDHIQQSLGDTVSNKKVQAPFLKIMTSIPFLALLLLHFGNLWGLFFLITAAPKFMSEVLKYNLSAAGILSALPYLARFVSAFIFGQVGDAIRKRNWLSVTKVRKIFCVFSHIIPGLFLIFLAFFVKSAPLAVAIMTLSLGINGAATLTNLQNSQDLAPNFAGTLYGIINFFGTTSGFISPLIVGYFTKERSTFEEWKYIFLIGATAYIVPAIVFAIFGSGLVQPWNDIKKNDDSEEAAETNTKL